MPPAVPIMGTIMPAAAWAAWSFDARPMLAGVCLYVCEERGGPQGRDTQHRRVSGGKPLGWVADSCRCKCVQVPVATLSVAETVGHLSDGQVAWSCVCLCSAQQQQQMQKPDRWHGVSACAALAAALQVHLTVNVNNAVSKRLLKMLPSNQARRRCCVDTAFTLPLVCAV